MTADLAAPAAPSASAGGTEPSQLDRVEAQLAALAAQVAADRADRERWKELTHELMPVAQGAMSVASRELEDLSADVTVEDLARFARTAARALPQLEGLIAQLGSANELVHEVTSLAGAGVGVLSQTLDTAESKGYFAFARGGGEILARVVESFGEDDLRALGDNVVLILQTVRQMTQPEVMTFLSRTVGDVQVVDDGPPPSTLALLRQLRDPQVRRGMGRALTVLKDLGAPNVMNTRPDTQKD